jgi:hypothetical protein
LPVRTQIRPVAGPARRWPARSAPGRIWLGSGHGPAEAVADRGRTGLDAALGHRPARTRTAGLCGTTGPGAGWGRWCARQALAEAGPAAARYAGAGMSSAGWPAGSRGGRSSRRKAGGYIGCRCRSSATSRCPGSCRCPGHVPGTTGPGPAGRPGPAGGALMSGALAGSNTPAGGARSGYGPAATASRTAAKPLTARPHREAPRYGCRNHRRPGWPGWPVRRQPSSAQ